MKQLLCEHCGGTVPDSGMLSIRTHDSTGRIAVIAACSDDHFAVLEASGWRPPTDDEKQKHRRHLQGGWE